MDTRSDTVYVELNKQNQPIDGSVKLNAVLILEAMAQRKSTYMQTWVALYSATTEHGWCSYNDFVHGANLGISHKTVKLHIGTLEDWGWVKIDHKKKRIYRIGQDTLIGMLNPEKLTPFAVRIYPDDWSTKKKYKNLEMALASSSFGDGGVTISRASLRNITNRSPRTQQKYQDRIKSTSNYASLGNFSNSREGDKELHYKDEWRNLFHAQVNGRFHVIKRMANTYRSHIELGIRRIRKRSDYAPVYTGSVNDRTKEPRRIYLNRFDVPDEYTKDEYYRQSRMRFNGGKLWVKERKNNPYSAPYEPQTLAEAGIVIA